VRPRADKNEKPTMEDAKQERVRNAQAELAEALRDLQGEGSFAEWEDEMLKLTSNVRKEATQKKLQALADSLGDEVKVKGRTFKRHQLGTLPYCGLSDPRDVSRFTYREVGVRNGRTIVPLDLIAGLAERATPALARNIVHGYARHDMRTHCAVMREAHCMPPSRPLRSASPRPWRRRHISRPQPSRKRPSVENTFPTKLAA
jgi:hypothetical protein